MQCQKHVEIQLATIPLLLVNNFSKKFSLKIIFRNNKFHSFFKKAKKLQKAELTFLRAIEINIIYYFSKEGNKVYC